MELNVEKIKRIADHFIRMLSFNPEVSEPAESKVRSNPALVLLQVIDNSNNDFELRMAGAKALEFFIKRHWTANLPDEAAKPLDESTSDLIKSRLVTTVLHAPSPLQHLLIDSVTVIGKFDFPQKWPQLIDEMVEKLGKYNINDIQGLLYMADALFKLIPYEIGTRWGNFEFVFYRMIAPMTQQLQKITVAINTCTHRQLFRQFYRSLLLLNKLFRYIGSVLSDYFPKQMETWMMAFIQQLDDFNDCGEHVELARSLQRQNYQNIWICLTKYVEKFKPLTLRLVAEIYKQLKRKDKFMTESKVELLLYFVFKCMHLHGKFRAFESLEDFCKFLPKFMQSIFMLLLLQENFPGPFVPIVGVLLIPALWNLSESVPALTRMLTLFIRKGSAQMLALAKLPDILVIIRKLLALQKHDGHVFCLLLHLIDYYPLEALQPSMPEIYELLLQQLKLPKKAKFVTNLMSFSCFYADKINAQFLLEHIKEMQPDMFVWLSQALLVTILNKLDDPLAHSFFTCEVQGLLLKRRDMLDSPSFKYCWAVLFQALKNRKGAIELWDYPGIF